MENRKSSFRKRDLILIVTVLLLCLAGGIGYRLAHRGPAIVAEVTIYGETVGLLDLKKDQELTVRTPYGGMNHLVIKGGEIFCDEANCPDKVCINQGRQSLEGSMIVCMPNAMVVFIRSNEP